MEKQWRNFEVLFQHVQQGMAPEATVLHDQRLKGRSGVHNQCDTVIRSNVGQLPYMAIVECQDRDKKVGLGFVREIRSKQEDTQAQAAIIVNRLGFTRNALKYARYHAIQTYTLADASARNWREVGVIPFVYGVISPVSGQAIVLNNERTERIGLQTDDGAEIPSATFVLEHVTGGRLSTTQVIKELWTRFAPQLPPSGPEASVFTDVGQLALVNEETRHPVVVKVTYQVQRVFHYGHLPIVNGHILSDVQKGAELSKSFTTETTSFKTIWEKWPKVSELAAVPINADMKMIGFSNFDAQGQNMNDLTFSLSTEP